MERIYTMTGSLTTNSSNKISRFFSSEFLKRILSNFCVRPVRNDCKNGLEVACREGLTVPNRLFLRVFILRPRWGGSGAAVWGVVVYERNKKCRPVVLPHRNGRPRHREPWSWPARLRDKQRPSS
jgi:hypothetical protein